MKADDIWPVIFGRQRPVCDAAFSHLVATSAFRPDRAVAFAKNCRTSPALFTRAENRN